MSQDLIKIRNVAIISSAVLTVTEILCFFFFNRTDFYGILLSGMLTFIFFLATLIFYMLAARSSQIQSKLKYLLVILIIKLVVSAVVFYLVYRSEYIGVLAFSFSFLVFFTVFFNLEIFMIYKKILFYRN